MNPDIKKMQGMIRSYREISNRYGDAMQRVAEGLTDANPSSENVQGLINILNQPLFEVGIAVLELVLQYPPFVIIYKGSVGAFIDRYGVNFAEVPISDGKGISTISSPYPLEGSELEQAFYMRVGHSLLEKRVVALADAEQKEMKNGLYPNITDVHMGKPLRLKG